jgi:hypothetical protein
MPAISKSADNVLTHYGNDVVWSPAGYAAFSGKALADYHQLDSLFLSWAEERGAIEFQFPNLIAAKDLAKIDYLESFGHLATLPACYHPNTGETECSSEQILTPAACYHFYSALQNSNFNNSQILTTKANCFRRESEYHPLQRQWCFSMREVVCIGSADTVRNFIATFRAELSDYFVANQMPVEFQHATDPFFNPKDNPKYVMQRIDPTKLEMVFNKDLAIGSLNNHRTTFGEAFNIRIDGEPAHSGCVAFGVERWMYARAARGTGHD